MNQFFFNVRNNDFLSEMGMIAMLSILLLGGLVCWNALVALIRLIVTLHSRAVLAWVVERLAAAVRQRRPWSKELRGMCLLLPWPWRLRNAAEQLDQGDEPAYVLETSSLLPKVLRMQAGSALRSSPEHFARWCDGLKAQPAIQAVAIRQLTFFIAQGVIMLAICGFIVVHIVPKIENILWQMGLPKARVFFVFEWMWQWKYLFLIIVFWLVTLGVWLISAWQWRSTQRLTAGRLLVIGSLARIPEAALASHVQPGTSFSAVAAAAQWTAATPEDLARKVAHAEFRARKKAAWLPALGVALAPIVLALPVGALVIAIMQVLISVVTQLEAFG